MTDIMNDPALAQKRFGGIPDECTYYKGLQGWSGDKYTDKDGRVELGKMRGIELTKKRQEIVDALKAVDENVRKALSVSGAAAGSTASSLIPIYTDPTIIDITRKETPLVELLRRVTNYGKVAVWETISARASATWGAEDPAMAEADDTTAQGTANIKMLRIKGRVTGFHRAASQQFMQSAGFSDSLAFEIENKTIDMKRTEENTIINGDYTTNNYEYDGLYHVLNDSSGNVTDNATTAEVALGQIRTMIRSAETDGGNVDLLVTDLTTFDAIKALLQNQLMYVNPMGKIAWGLEVIVFEGKPIMKNKWISQTTGEKMIFALDTSIIENRVLQDMTMEFLAQTNDTYPFMMKEYVVLAIKAPTFCGLVKRIK